MCVCVYKIFAYFMSLFPLLFHNLVILRTLESLSLPGHHLYTTSSDTISTLCLFPRPNTREISTGSYSRLRSLSVNLLLLIPPNCFHTFRNSLNPSETFSSPILLGQMGQDSFSLLYLQQAFLLQAGCGLMPVSL